MWYLEPEPATRAEVKGRLDQIAWWECKHFAGEHRARFGIDWDMSEALWAEYYS